jgi:hypothetical protein
MAYANLVCLSRPELFKIRSLYHPCACQIVRITYNSRTAYGDGMEDASCMRGGERVVREGLVVQALFGGPGAQADRRVPASHFVAFEQHH